MAERWDEREGPHAFRIDVVQSRDGPGGRTSKCVRKVVSTDDGSRVVSGGDDGALSLRAKAGAAAAGAVVYQEVATFKRNSAIFDVDMAHNPETGLCTIAACAEDGEVITVDWPADSAPGAPRVLFRFSGRRPMHVHMASVAISRDARTVIAGGGSQAAFVFRLNAQGDYEAHACLGTPVGDASGPASSSLSFAHCAALDASKAAPITAVALSPDGRLAAFANFVRSSRRSAVFLWRVPGGPRAGAAPAPAPAGSSAPAPAPAPALLAEVHIPPEGLVRLDGKKETGGIHQISMVEGLLAFGNGDGDVSVYRIPPGAADAPGRVQLEPAAAHRLSSYRIASLRVYGLVLFRDGSGFAVSSEQPVNAAADAARTGISECYEAGTDGLIHVCALPPCRLDGGAAARKCALVRRVHLPGAVGVCGLSVTADGRTLFAGCEDGTARAITLLQPAGQPSYPLPTGTPGGPAAAGFQADVVQSPPVASSSSSGGGGAKRRSEGSEGAPAPAKRQQRESDSDLEERPPAAGPSAEGPASSPRGEGPAPAPEQPAGAGAAAAATFAERMRQIEELQRQLAADVAPELQRLAEAEARAAALQERLEGAEADRAGLKEQLEATIGQLEAERLAGRREAKAAAQRERQAAQRVTAAEARAAAAEEGRREAEEGRREAEEGRREEGRRAAAAEALAAAAEARAETAEARAAAAEAALKAEREAQDQAMAAAATAGAEAARKAFIEKMRKGA
eukprot:tig00000385_g24741.t1